MDALGYYRNFQQAESSLCILFHCAVAHSCDDMALEEEIDNSDTDNADHVGSKAWSVVVEILACVVVLEQRQGPHF